MIIVTSLSPGHVNKDNQTAAITSWKDYAPRYSMNSQIEIDTLKDQYDIDFIRTDKTMDNLFGKPLVNINAMIDFAIAKKEDLLLINSDIVIDDLPDFRTDGITIFQRYDYTTDHSDGKINPLGFDVFYIPKALLTIYPPSIFAMGAPWWDYWLPYRTILARVPVYNASCKCVYHKAHNMQYDLKQWSYIGEFFKLEFKIDSRMPVPQVATMMIKRINLHLI